MKNLFHSYSFLFPFLILFQIQLTKLIPAVLTSTVRIRSRGKLEKWINKQSSHTESLDRSCFYCHFLDSPHWFNQSKKKLEITEKTQNTIQKNLECKKQNFQSKLILKAQNFSFYFAPFSLKTNMAIQIRKEKKSEYGRK